MKTIKRFASLALVGLMGTSLVACGSKEEPVTKPVESNTTQKQEESKKPVTITIGMPATHIEISGIKEHKEKWEAKTGNILEIQAVDDNQFDQLLLTKMASGGMWDIFIGETGTQGSKYNHEKNLVDLSGENWVQNLSEVGKEFASVNDKVYCLPSGGINSFGIVYNTEVFEKNNIEIPTTFEEFEKVCNTLKEAGVTPLYISMKDGWTVNQIMNGEWPNILAANEGLLETLNNNEIRWDEVPEVVDMFTRMKSWVDNGWVNSDMATASYEMAQKAIASGEAAMMYMGDWADPEYTKTEPSGAGKIGMFAAPSKDGKSYLAAAGPGGMMISNQSNNIDVAKDFLNYMSSEEAVQYLFDTNKCTSVWTNMQNDNLSRTLADSQVYFDNNMSQKHYNQTYIVTPSAEADSAFLSVLLGQKTPEQAAKIWSDELVKVGRQLGFEGFDK
ncbi:ABC transporter substrate-binding protein [Niameybacter massiliensis]|uniref:ABC transporter substrate-binding protein n=1 Tax=Niameybacter massiliensis TaxID=1658108 RepID=UPI0006B51FDE|nr:ABC transporter substrate-binding protein [Niameybacter massiliensis]